jgi:hypothetical protein
VKELEKIESLRTAPMNEMGGGCLEKTRGMIDSMVLDMDERIVLEEVEKITLVLLVWSVTWTHLLLVVKVT